MQRLDRHLRLGDVTPFWKRMFEQYGYDLGEAPYHIHRKLKGTKGCVVGETWGHDDQYAMSMRGCDECFWHSSEIYYTMDRRTAIENFLNHWNTVHRYAKPREGESQGDRPSSGGEIEQETSGKEEW